MNKFEKLMVALLGAGLAWYFFFEMPREKKAAAERQAQHVAEQTKADVPVPGADASDVIASEAKQSASESQPSAPSEPERIVVLENDELRLELSSWGAVVKKATLKEYAERAGEMSNTNPALVFDFAASPLGAIVGDAALGTGASYAVKSASSNEVVFANGAAERKITLAPGYLVTYDEKFARPGATPNTLSLGLMRMGGSKNDLLSVDSMARDAGKGKPGVIHHCEGDSPLKSYLVGGAAGGCSGSSSAVGLPAETCVSVPGAQTWIAAKNRFFVAALARSTSATTAFATTIARDTRAATYRPESVAVAASFADLPAARTSVFYVGPKKQALLWDLGMKDVMEFGMWRWICYPVVWLLNLFDSWIPNYGIAIILLTIFVRLLFWPLTHKSTIGMKKMQEIQPLMKELQAKFKDNPQRLQQETWALYKNHKVNPMSSCLPMLIQIPVFIALFNVLRSAVELRYAPFLWIADLSEPEALFASWFPFGGLNILPILMAVTTGLQSYFTPSSGDRKQQQMIMVMMPLMMLFFFYSFPAALSLYWLLSNMFSIVQMWMIRRSTQQAQGAAVVPDEVIDPPRTRQMRRHS